MTAPETLRLCRETHRLGFSLSHLALLSALPESGWMTASELEAATGWGRPAIYVAAKDLAANGLVNHERGSKGGSFPRNEMRIELRPEARNLLLL